MGKRVKRIKFENRLDEYVAINGKIAEIGLQILEDRYGGKGFMFSNDDFNNEATMSWPSDTRQTVLADARADFEEFIVLA